VERGWLRGLAHITGGGLVDNLPRVLPAGTGARVRRGSWPVPPVFDYIRRVGNVAEQEMDRTFNMGLGMVVVTGRDEVQELEAHLEAAGEAAFRIGEIIEGDCGVVYA
jgi:phosphoribosylformylglycinamidine cyclo-ligase